MDSASQQCWLVRWLLVRNVEEHLPARGQEMELYLIPAFLPLLFIQPEGEDELRDNRDD